MDELTLDDLGLPSERDWAGETLSGWCLGELLGRGAMGSVYVASRGAERAVVKILAAHLTTDPRLCARFQREWAALARISPPHPNVVAVYSAALDVVPHIVMEHVEGVSLLRVLQEHGRAEPVKVAGWGLDLARGLSAVHSLGMVHRDVKPANVLVTPEGHAKLVDFGLAKDVFRTSLTQAGRLLGTALYMSPEQWGDAPVDARSDVFGLGATLFHLLAGRAPFVGEDVHETADLARSGEHPVLSDLVPGVPRELERVIERMLMPSLRYRYASAHEVAVDLERVLAGGEATVPCLLDASGKRWPLLGGRRITLGRAAKCEVRLEHEDVAEQHAQVRREEPGFTVRALRGTGVEVDGSAVPRGGRELRDGDTIKLGSVALRFFDPNQRARSGQRTRSSPLLDDVERKELSAPLIYALIEQRDPRVVLRLLERLTPDPVEEDRVEALLTSTLGAATASAVRAWRDRKQEAQRAQLVATLREAAGVDFGFDPAPWLAWWAQVRAGAPPQFSEARPSRQLELRGEAGSTPIPPSGSLLLGSDPRCHVIVPGAARLERTLVPLHRRVAVVAERAGVTLEESGGRAAFLDPGHEVRVGPERLRCVLDPTPLGCGSTVDWTTFEALVALGQPAAFRGLVQLLARASDLSCFVAEAQAEGLSSPELLAHLHQRYTSIAEVARRTLASQLGGHLALDAAGWQAICAQRKLGPQVTPRGWVEGG